MFAFAADNKDNYESWGKYELDELQDAYAEMSEEEKGSKTGLQIKERIEELEPGKDQVEELRQEEALQSEDTEQEVISEPKTDSQPELQPKLSSRASQQKTPIIIAGIIIGVIILMLVTYFI